MLEQQAISDKQSRQDALYEEVSSGYGAALERLARAYELDAERRRDLVQEIHLALWQSLAGFDERCSLRTWIYRVAHNVATTHVIRDRRAKSVVFIELEALDQVPDERSVELAVARHAALDRLLQLIHQLKPPDRQVILCYLEDMEAAAIAEITGLSAINVATKIHRVKSILARQFHEGKTS